MSKHPVIPVDETTRGLILRNFQSDYLLAESFVSHHEGRFAFAEKSGTWWVWHDEDGTHVNGGRQALQRAITPWLAEVALRGHDWTSGTLTAAQVHLTSATTIANVTTIAASLFPACEY